MIKTIDKNIRLVDFQGFMYPHCNCLWIEDEINCLIDTSPGEADLRYLQLQKVDLIINSHGHIDHYLYNHCFPDSKILMHAGDEAIARSAAKYLEVFGLTTFTQDPRLQQFYLEGVQYRPTRIDGYIEDHQLVRLGSTNLEVLHLPGHSPGHCGFLFPEQGFVFTADIEFSAFGPWYANMNCSLSDFLQSIERLIALKPDYMISGHGEAIIKGDISKRLQEYRDIIYTRQRRIVDLLYRGRHSLADLAGEYPVYRQPPKPEAVFYIYEQVMILTHLRYLQEQGYVIQEGQYYYLQEGLNPKAF